MASDREILNQAYNRLYCQFCSSIGTDCGCKVMVTKNAINYHLQQLRYREDDIKKLIEEIKNDNIDKEKLIKFFLDLMQ